MVIMRHSTSPLKSYKSKEKSKPAKMLWHYIYITPSVHCEAKFYTVILHQSVISFC